MNREGEKNGLCPKCGAPSFAGCKHTIDDVAKKGAGSGGISRETSRALFDKDQPVKEDLVGKGIGTKMMAFCESYAKEHGYKSIYCYARDSAVNFYLKNDYVSEGDCFNEDGIHHLKMRKIVSFDFMASTSVEKDFIYSAIVNNNLEQVAPTQKNHRIPFNYCFKNNEIVIAGINAEMYFWNILHISILFVDKDYRHNKLGSYLLKKVESEAKQMGATLVHLDTFDFQAKDFYLKHGYEIFGILEDCPPGHKRYYLKKTLKK